MRTRRTPPIACLLFAVMMAIVAGLSSASRAIAQPSDVGESAVRGALTRWMEDFNAGNAEGACRLFSGDLRYDYRGFAERTYQDMCDGLRRALTDQTKRYAYSLAIKEVLVSGDLAIVRLTWTLTVTKPGAPPEISLEHGIDIFKKESDAAWRIIRFLAYDEAR